jgi:hypothetical protein
MLQFSFAQLSCLDGDSTPRWGVKVSGDLGGTATKQAGQTVTVSKRKGGSEQVKLGGRVATANGGRAAWYTIDRGQRQRPQRAASTSKGCTDAQYYKLRKLYEEHDPGDDTMFDPFPAQDAIDKRTASQLIDRLKEHPKRA